ncbi:hypothetical protein D0C36_16015 [Mucilaginibacter conchicola]|uniref:protein-glutamate methylesterase n=1 Tax=Mucilaginibacter conchicola TaxID=2303333 RepID=A0A372NUJ1_9SPHI|nr:chemotaxis protein CheB [Mucilaginibacter conchicola]RFZ92896.1 hypothetical protein D0C36_16015 [Mucilaginibacter conchicola]
MPVIRMTGDMDIKPGHVYVLIQNTFITIDGQQLILQERKKDEIINRAVDIFFHSLAESFGSEAVGIVLSGGGSDGLEGTKAIEKAGGYVMVQTPDTSKFSGMPNSVVQGDDPHIVASPVELAEKLKAWVDRQI